MGEINILEELQKDNPTRRTVDLQIFADALAVYIEASRNINANGAIVMHPRTGAPIENPYLKIQTAKGLVLNKLRAIQSDRIMGLLGL